MTYLITTPFGQRMATTQRHRKDAWEQAQALVRLIDSQCKSWEPRTYGDVIVVELEEA